MNRAHERPIVTSVVWQDASQIHELQGEAVESLGYPHRLISCGDALPSGTEIVLVTGPLGPLLPVVRQLVSQPPDRRPVLAYWFEESLDLRPPDWARRTLAIALSEMHRDDPEGRLQAAVAWILPAILGNQGKRLGFLGDIFWLHKRGLLNVLALCSTVYADYLARHGIRSIVVPRGFHPAYGSRLQLERDIAVVWLGKMRTRRRHEAVYGLARQLERRGQKMMIFDGESNDFVFGERRTKILNRAWFVLNVYFSSPSDELSLRHCIAAANDAVVLTEPSSNQYPFVPGQHLVECPLGEMADRVMYYLNHREEWCSIAANMRRLMEGELTLEQSLAQILGQAETATRR